jgi:hypothetical protein
MAASVILCRLDWKGSKAALDRHGPEKGTTDAQ